MTITIRYEKDSPELKRFVYNYIPNVLLNRFYSTVDRKKLKLIDKYYGIESEKILVYTLKHLSKSNISAASMYIIGVNKNLKYKGEYVNKYLQLIAYGDLRHRGYPILKKVFEYVTLNIDNLFGGWLCGN